MKFFQKVLVLGVLALLMPLLVGMLSLSNNRAMQEALADQVRSDTALKNHVYGDMMHDAIRSDVLNALRAASGNDRAALAAAKADMTAHIATFDEKLAANKALELEPELSAKLDALGPSIEAYTRAARDLVELAQSDPGTADAGWSGFMTAFTDLEGKMSATSGAFTQSNEAHSAEATKAGESNAFWQKLFMAVALVVVALCLWWLYYSMKSLLRGEDEAKIRAADSEGQLNAVSKSQAVIEFKLDGTILTANENFCRTMGYTLDELKGKHHSMFADTGISGSPEYRQFWEKLNRGDYDSGQYKRIGKGGRAVWIQASYNPIMDLNGKPFKVVKYATDVTEAVLRASFTLRALGGLENVAVNVMLADDQFNIVYGNTSLNEMLRTAESDIRRDLPGFTASKIVGTNIDSFHKNPAHQRGMLTNLKSSHKAQLKLGGRTFDLIVNPINDDNGTRLGYVVEWLDATAALAAREVELRSAAENTRIKNALDKCSTNVMIADASNHIIYMNETVTAMMQGNEAELRKSLPNFNSRALVGENIDVFHKNPSHQRGMLAALKSTYRTQIQVGRLTFGLIANPILDAKGERVGTVVEWNDRTIEVGVENEVAAIVAGATRGDFTQRIDAESKQGFFRGLAENLNKLLQTSEVGLNEVVRVLAALAQGDLTETITNHYEGTFGQLKDDSNATVKQLSEIVTNIKGSTDSINTAAREIAAGNTDLSARTEEQAASLEETASSMEELTSTVKQNADNARRANQLAIGAGEVAVKGGTVVSQVVTTMDEINTSSKKIVDIISVIDGIAFQTNILALNAAVEAARAGEQGRGFAVVASEVRSLAQRSAAAAKEIKGLINDSVERVANGTMLVDEAGKTMAEVVSAVKRVTDIMAEISAASQEQSTGIEQVNQTITQMDEVTQQNAAMVEEATAAAHSLEDQAENLMQAVSVFRLSDDAPTASRALGSAKTVASKSASLPSRAKALAAPTRKPAARKAPAGGLAMAESNDDQDWKEM